MDIDQRLEFLLQSTESLHASLQEQSKQIAEQSTRINHIDAREKKARIAVLSAIKAYLEVMNSNNGEE